ncbi:bifunctional adenosylcobinamide kinase/adenosylcobinamide-phosphate guanylyltransferase [Catenovulum maritimum]|uniref:Bifunctional adenosylcobalamin biosynthesis protein n=1 Tax=Catenovulum maritimum TaxID=1513271 RepID=A0A0J8JLA5_9ALTE|nr:bifunctional adenosylcobinamide kinase/adenosylcobinamide-phosphate guanylyltransferase [Catenovulum maritimum]KMT65341.1 hypothetical protein XM47_09950 [Catenovulum maritimum]
MINLIIGGARSGKSNYAERLAKALFDNNTSKMIHYIATAECIDQEMEQRINQHRLNRLARFKQNTVELHEVPLELGDKLKQLNQPNNIILVDCLTLWLNNQLYYSPEQDFADLCESTSNLINNLQADVIFVSNEVGLGIIPHNEISRRFVDEAGRLNQAIAKNSDNVIFMLAGIEQCLKGAVYV